MVLEKLQKLIDFIKQLMLCKRTGCLEINISQGGITSVLFKEKVM